ncbi:MAG: hypothetical protein ACQEUZ_01895 [Pseudomonadota bacterium]
MSFPRPGEYWVPPVSDEDWRTLEDSVGVPLAAQARDQVERTMENAVVAAFFAARRAAYGDARGSVKRDGRTRHATPLLALLRAVDRLMEANARVTQDETARAALNQYEAEAIAGPYPPLDQTLAALSFHRVSLRLHLREDTSDPFDTLVGGLSRAFEMATGERPPRATAPGDRVDRFAKFVRAVDHLLSDAASWPVNVRDDASEGAWRNAIWKALKASHERKHPREAADSQENS